MLTAKHVLRWCSTLLFVGSLLISATQATPSRTDDHEITGEQAAVVGFAERAAVQAVNFRQGDAEGFARSRTDFTDSGWQDFMKHMQGFLDEKGAPTFTSSFVTSGNAKVLGEEGGIVRLRIPGTLTQSNGPSKTTYRAALEVDAGGDLSGFKSWSRSHASGHQHAGEDNRGSSLLTPLRTIAGRLPCFSFWESLSVSIRN